MSLSVAESIQKLRHQADGEPIWGEHGISIKAPTSSLTPDLCELLVGEGILDEYLQLNEMEVVASEVHEKFPECTIPITIEPPSNITSDSVFRSCSQLLEKLKQWPDVYRSYYLWEEDVAWTPDTEKSVPPLIQARISWLKMTALLYRLADYRHNNAGVDELTFLNSSKIVIPIVMPLTEAGVLDVEPLLEINAPGSLGRDTAAATFKDNLSHFLSATDANLRLERLLVSFSSFKEKVLAEYRIFSAADKYTELRGEIRARLLAFEKSIHGIYADIYLKLFGIPLAIVAVVIKFDDLSHGQRHLFLVAATFTAIFITYMVRSQWFLLGYISECVSQDQKDLEMEYGLRSGELGKRFEKIATRAKTANRTLVSVCIIVWIAVVISHVAVWLSA